MGAAAILGGEKRDDLPKDSAKVAVWREEENREMDIGAEGTCRCVRYLVGDFQGNSRTQAAVVL